MDEKMLVVNVGVQGITRVRYRGGNGADKGFVVEHKHFPPLTPVECSKEMATGLLKKYNNPTMAIIFRMAEGFALSDAPVVPLFSYDAELVDGEKIAQSENEKESIQPVVKFENVFVSKRRGRPKKK